MSNKPYIALIGHGVWGRQHARVLRELGALRWVYDANAMQLIKVEEATQSVGDVLNDAEVRGVVIATPPSTHHDLTVLALQKGKHVLVEKPMATTVREAQEMLEIAQHERRVLMVGHLMRYHSGFQAFASQVKERNDVHYLYSIRQQSGIVRTEENVLWSLAPHDVSMLVALAGVPQGVRCIGKVCGNGDVADIAATLYEFPNGIRGHMFVSWLHPSKVREVCVVHNGGSLVFRDEPTEEEPLHTELRHFLHCIETGAQPLTDAKEGLNVVRVLTACQRSMDYNGKWMEVA